MPAICNAVHDPRDRWRHVVTENLFQRSFERSCGVNTMNMCLVRPMSAALIDGFLAYTRVCVGLDAAKAWVKTKPGLTSFLRHANTRQTEEPLHWVLKAYHSRFFFCLIEYKVLICRFTIMLQKRTPLYNCAWISIWHTRIEIGKCLSMVDSLSRNNEKLVERISVEPRRYFFFLNRRSFVAWGHLAMFKIIVDKSKSMGRQPKSMHH